MIRRPVLWLAAAFFLANLIGLDRSPVVWLDEVTLNDPAREWAENGALRSSVFAGHSSFEKIYLWQPPGQAMLTATVYRIFGFGIWQTRLPPLILAAGVLVALHLLALRLLGDERPAFLTVLIYALDPKFLQVSRAGRMDPQCLLLLLLAAIATLRALDSQPARFHRDLALAGLAAGLAGLTHPIAVAWAAGLGLPVVLGARAKRRLTGPLVFGAMAALPPVLWIAWGLWMAGPEVFAAQFLRHGQDHLSAGPVLSRLAAELRNYAGQYSLTPLLLAAHAISLSWFFLRHYARREAKSFVALLFSATFLFNVLVMTKGLGYYFLYPGVMLAVCTGAFLAAILPHGFSPPRSAREALGAALALLLGLNLLAGGLAGRWLSLAFQWRARAYAPVERAVRGTIPPGSVVWGPAEAWYAVAGSRSSLRLLGLPDPEIHDYLILRPGQEDLLKGRASRKTEIGEPLPPVLGWRRPSADYSLSIWSWNRR